MTQVYHQAKFRWTENLTCRFIQLRKENGRLFTGRKYSAQAGWEYILRQMRQEFPTIMADVHYRVLKKKWSNLLQQYKELKNPVHGDKNKADDVSWPFYGAIDEVLGNCTRRDSHEDDNVVNPHEFLCVSVTPDEPASPSEDEPRFPSDEEIERNDNPSFIALRRLQALNEDCSIEIERVPRGSRSGRRIVSRKRSSNDDTLISRLPRATELSIKTVKASPAISVKDLSKLRGQGGQRNPRNGNISSVPSREDLEVDVEEEEEEEEEEGEGEEEEEDEEREMVDGEYETRETKRTRRTRRGNDQEILSQTENSLERRIDEFVNYTKRRDDENRNIMLRILQAVEKIADKL